MHSSTALASILSALATGSLIRNGMLSMGSEAIATDGQASSSYALAAENAELRRERGDAPAIPLDKAVHLQIVDPAINLSAPAVPTTLPGAPPIVNSVALIPNTPAHPANPVTPPIDPIVLPLVNSANSIPSVVTSILLTSQGVTEEEVTTQWLETWVGGTSQTWVPKTIVYHYEPMPTAPSPGRGEIGMGTLTGDTGKTQTVMGVAPVHTARLIHGVAAAVGVGIAGLVV